MEEKLFELLTLENQKNELAAIVSCNEKSKHFGLMLNEEQAKELVLCKNESLKKYERIEFEDSILEKLIFTFCDSNYIYQDNYLEILKRLQDIFYEFKNNSLDLLTDDELMEFMYEQFEGVCYGDLNYLEGTCLEVFAEAIRKGYRGYQSTGGKNEYGKFDEVQRWDKELYQEMLKEIFW